MRNLILIYTLLLFSSCSEHSAENDQPNSFKNQDTTYWEVNDDANPGHKIMLIDDSFIVNYYEVIIEEGSEKMSESEIAFGITTFHTKENNSYLSEFHTKEEINFVVKDSLNIQLNYISGDDSGTLNLKRFNYGVHEKQELNKTWNAYLNEYENDTLVHFTGYDFGLELYFFHKGENVYESVASIVDTTEIGYDSYLGPDLIIQDLNSSQLYQIPNFFKNDRHFFPIKFQETNIERMEMESKSYIEKAMKYIADNPDFNSGDTIPFSELNK